MLSCIPLFTEGENDRWSLVATATLIIVKGQCFFLTAGHAADDLTGKSTAVLINGRMFQLNKLIWNRFSPKPLENSREEDVVDFAVMKIPEKLVEELDGKYWLFRESHFCSPAETEGQLFEIYGFPGKKSDRKTTKNSVTVHCSHVVTTEVATKIRRHKRFNPFIHLALDFDRKDVIDDTGRHITHPDTHGMSGGPAIASTSGGPMLAGILIEGDPYLDALIYIRSRLILEWIDFQFDNFK